MVAPRKGTSIGYFVNYALLAILLSWAMSYICLFEIPSLLRNFAAGKKKKTKKNKF